MQAAGILADLAVKADFFIKYYRYRGYEGCTPADIRERQRRRLERLLRHALARSAFYRALYGEAGITLADVPDVSLTDLPIIDKGVVMDHYDDLVCDPALRKADLLAFLADPANADARYRHRYTVIHTSGSSGRIGLFVYDDRHLNWLNILFLKYLYGVRRLVRDMLPQRVAFWGVTGGHYAGYTLTSRCTHYGLPYLPLAVETPLEEAAARLNAFQPTILTAYSSLLGQLAEAQRAGTLAIAPQLIFAGAEPLTPACRAACREAFGVAPRNVYAASESIIIGAETRYQDGMVLFNDWNIVETVDADDRPVGSGEYGQVILTNLYNDTQPLIRYRMDDVLRIARSPGDRCLPLEVIEDIQGRTEDFLTFDQGGRTVAIHPIVFVEFYVEGLRQLQIVKRSAHTFLARVSLTEASETAVARVRQGLQGILDRHRLGETVRFEVEVVGDIPADRESGKYRLIVDETASHAAAGRGEVRLA